MSTLRMMSSKEVNEYEFFYNDDSQHSVIVRSVLKNDVDALKQLRDNGAFDFDQESLGFVKENPNTIIHPIALPNVDALGIVFNQQKPKSDKFYFPDGKSGINVGTTTLIAPNEMIDFILDVSWDVVSYFREINKQKIDEKNVNIPANYENIKTATLSIIAAFACAIDDANLLKSAKNEAPEILQISMRPGPLVKDYQHFLDDDHLVSPALYAIHFAAKKCISTMGPEVFSSPLSKQLYVKRKKDEGVRFPTMMGDYLEQMDAWGKPDVAEAVFAIVIDKNRQVRDEHKEWVYNSIPNAIIGGRYPHLTDLMAKNYPELLRFNMKALEEGAIDLANPMLLKTMLKEIPFPSRNKEGMLKNPQHPVYRIINQETYAYGNKDDALVLVLEQMNTKGILVDEYDSRDRSNNTLAHIAAQNNWCNVVSLLEQYGFDFESENALGKTPLRIAQDINHHEFENVINQAIKRRMVRDMIDGSMFFEMKDQPEVKKNKPRM